MGLGRGGQEVDEEVKLLAIPVGAEAHVVNALDGGQDPQPFLAVTQSTQKGRPRTVDIAVVVARIVDLVGVFRVPRKVLVGEVRPCGPCPDVVGEV